MFFMLQGLRAVGWGWSRPKGGPAERGLDDVGPDFARSQGSLDEVIALATPVVAVRARRFLARRGLQQCGPLEHGDLVQEVWVRLLAHDAKALRGFDPSQGVSFAQYVVMLADRALAKIGQRELHTQKRGRDVKVVPLDGEAMSSDTPESQVEGHQGALALHQHLMEHLSPKGQLIYALLYDDMLTPEQIVTKLGVSRQVVYNWQHQIRKLASSFLASESVSG